MIKSIGKKFADAFLLLHYFIPYNFFYPASDAVHPFHPFYLILLFERFVYAFLFRYLLYEH